MKKSKYKICIKCKKKFEYHLYQQKRCDKCRTLKCEQCDKKFIPKNKVYKRKRFCSKKCYSNWQKNKPLLINILKYNVRVFSKKDLQKLSESQKGRKVSKKTRKKISKTLTGRKRPNFKKRRFGNTRCKHHKDLNKENNQKRNILILTNSQHQSLHRRAYDYLVKINKINNYIKWFKRKYIN